MHRGRGEDRNYQRGRSSFNASRRGFGYSYNYNPRGQSGSTMGCFRCGDNHRIEDCLKPQRINDERDGKKYVRVTLEESEWKRICEMREEDVMRKRIEEKRAEIELQRRLEREMDGVSKGKKKGEEKGVKKRKGKRRRLKSRSASSESSSIEEKTNELTGMMQQMMKQMNVMNGELSDRMDKMEENMRRSERMRNENKGVDKRSTTIRLMNDEKKENDRRQTGARDKQRVDDQVIKETDVSSTKVTYIPKNCREKWQDEVGLEDLINEEDDSKGRMIEQSDRFVWTLNDKWNKANEGGQRRRMVANVRRQIYTTLRNDFQQDEWAQVVVNAAYGWRVGLVESDDMEDMVAKLAKIYL